jgi:hypothetical protein
LASILTTVQSIAGTVYLGVSPSQVSNVSAAGFGAGYSISNGNSDITLRPAVPTLDYRHADLGNVAQLSGRSIHLTLKNVVSNGFDTGLFFEAAASPNGQKTLTWRAAISGILPQAVPYSAIDLYSVATFLGSAVQFSSPKFTLAYPTIALNGSLPPSGLVNHGSPTSDSYIVFLNDDGSKGNLASVGWSFSADVTITASGTTGDVTKFELSGKTLNYTPSSVATAAVPETSTWVMGFLALGAVVFLVSRRTKANADVLASPDRVA